MCLRRLTVDGIEALPKVKTASPKTSVLIMTAFGSSNAAIKAMELGAFDYITKPFDVDQLTLSVQKALAERALRSEVARLRDEVQVETG